MSYGLPLILLIVLHKPIEEVTSLLIVTPVLSKVASTDIDNIIFWLIAVYLLLLFLSRIISFVPSAKAFLIQVIISLIYLYYRHYQDVWILHPLKGHQDIYYTDIIIEIAFLNAILLIRQLFAKKPLIAGKGFDDDSSLGKQKPDLLGYEPYVQSLATRVEQSRPEKAIAIGINGRWGSGKTSFFDLLKRKMVTSPIIVIDFNPWNSLSPNAIIKDFFDTVQRATRPYHSQLPKLLDTYTDKLISLHSEGWGKFAKELKSVILPEQSLNDLYDQINKEIKAIDRKIIIYIDDLDRLDKEEIAEVIRLIRNTASFSNTFFIVAYDRDYVLTAIKAMNAFNHNHFLEKIFQIEVNLPYFDPAIIQRKLADLLKAYYSEDYHENIEKEIVGTPSAYPNYFEGWIETLRDVTRLSNGIKLNLDMLLTEVVFSEFVRLEILRLKYPSVYEAFYRRSGTFLHISDKHNGTDGYQLKTISDKRGEPFYLTNEHSEFELFVQQNASRLSVEQHEIAPIIDLIDGLFGVSMLTARFRSHLSVVHPSRFELYFSYSVLEGKLSEAEFLKAIESDFPQLKTQIDEWNREKLNFEVLRRFLQIKTFKNRKRFETTVEGIFYFARQPDNDAQYGFENRQLADLLSDDKKRISKQFYDGKSDEYATFLRRLLDGATSPYSFDSTFLEHLNKSSDDSFPIHKQERLKIVQKLFYDYTQNFKAWDYNLWHLYHACSYKEWTPTGGSVYRSDTIYPVEANQIMIATITKHIDAFLPVIIDFPPFVNDHMYISGIIKTIFGSYEAFGDFLNNLDTSSSVAVKEFDEFYRQLATQNFEKAVPFEFTVIKVVNRGQVN
ncbi:KAP family P-loop NTPase fold protein [Mucilaginibacter ginsenosidivorax]|uniref:KAP family P-loop NTPase fold protein n=1 Tax=Mucilaginibacter ginsenosidivorax TaxID=862126 RepID=UPI0013157078|nr:P-loop NTPase fold protein [Mucilaginibacter ginsenosidivorax]